MSFPETQNVSLEILEKTPKIKLKDLDFSILKKIIQIYDVTVGGNGSQIFSKEYLYYASVALQVGNQVCWKFGSRLGKDSYLYLETLIPTDPMRNKNYIIQFRFDVSDDLRTEESERLAGWFNIAVNSYLYIVDMLVIEDE